MEGRTALVTGGGTTVGRAIALALAARGVRIVVTGRDEKALGETVGEVVHGGGKARHLAGDQTDPGHLAAAFERAKGTFGVPDIAVVAEALGAEKALNMLAKHVGSPGRLLVALALPASGSSPLALARELALSVRERAITCNAIVLDPTTEEDAAADAAELAVFLCTTAADRITGQAIGIDRGPVLE